MRQQPPPICLTTSPATITGTLAEANVIAVPAPGIDAGADGFSEMIKAIKNCAAYVNVHSVLHPGVKYEVALAAGIARDMKDTTTTEMTDTHRRSLPGALHAPRPVQRSIRHDRGRPQVLHEALRIVERHVLHQRHYF